MRWFWNRRMRYGGNRKPPPNVLYGLMASDGTMDGYLEATAMEVLPREGSHDLAVYQLTRIERRKLIVVQGDV